MGATVVRPAEDWAARLAFLAACQAAHDEDPDDWHAGMIAADDRPCGTTCEFCGYRWPERAP